MMNIVGVRFRKSGMVKYYDTGGLEETEKIVIGTHVLVDSERGLEYGTVMMPPRAFTPKETEDGKAVTFPRVQRVATPDDDDTYRNNCRRETDAYRICLGKIEYRDLPMNLVEAEYSFDRSKLLFYFTADGRVDFRELVKDLAAEFRTRIELRQIGVRDEAKLVGGFGICGRELCCSTYMNEFVPVSIKMAKEQNLSLNPVKISGACGRLMCCLQHEEDTYEYLNKQLPRVGAHVTTIDGYDGVVSEVSVLRQRVKVTIEIDDEKELRDYSVDELRFQRGQYIHEITATERDLILQASIEDSDDDIAAALELEAEDAAETKDGTPSGKADKGDKNRRRRHRERTKEQRSFSGNYYKDQRGDHQPEGSKEQKDKLYSKKFKSRKRNYNKKSRNKGSQEE